jgi:glycine/D-amino acid oxidase-like deaminating enzyme
MTDIAIVGAGPYGLACAAHLRALGAEVEVYGEPMQLWRRMPPGMMLRSAWEASTISDPTGGLTLDRYEEVLGRAIKRPIPLADFLAYARWFQEHTVPDVRRRRVLSLERSDGHFRLELDEGSARARRVVLATGLDGLGHRPDEFASLPRELAPHSSEISDPTVYTGLRVGVVGAGQSAIETAVLLKEAGAEVTVIARAPIVRWLRRSAFLHGRSGLTRRLLYPPTDVGPPVLNQIVAKPPVFRAFPRRVQKGIAYRSIRPAAAAWLIPRLEGLQLALGRTIISARPAGPGVVLRLDGRSQREFDRLVLATGYRVDVRRHPLISPELLRSLRERDGYPILRRGFESSVSDLHFVGASAALSFGPVMRFVSGTWFTAPTVAAHVAAADRRSMIAVQSAPAAVAPVSGGRV